MTAEEKRKLGGGKLSRSETVTVRLDPKLRYLAELAARKQRRTLSSFIEWAIEDTLKRVPISDYQSNDITLHDVSNSLWDVDDADRFANLALNYPEWMNHEEQVLWKLVRETGFIWKGKHDSDGEWEWDVSERSLIRDRLRKYWEDFKKVVAGEADKSILPVSSKKTNKAEFDDFDDDIPL